MSDVPNVETKVRVTVRTELGSERVVHQFEGKVVRVWNGPPRRTVVTVELPFGTYNFVSVPLHLAEFEVVGDE